MEKSLSTSNEEIIKEEEVRVKWKSCDFLLSLIGYGVGIGNIWRFPYLCAKNGGAVFLIPYAVFMVILALPLAFLELSIGQFSGKSAYDVWDICPGLRGVGVSATILSAIYSIYFNTIMAWVLYYLVHSFMSPLPWATCDNWWNTDRCLVRMSTNNDSLKNITNYQVEDSENKTFMSNSTNYRSASEEFWSFNVLRISSGLEDVGPMHWHLIVSLLVAWTLIFLCIIKGVKSVGKVVYVTAIAPYIFITIILIRAATLPGAIDGIKFYIIPDFKQLANFQIWIQALMQIFYSMGIGWGGFTTIASYNKFDNNIFRDTIIFCFVGEGTSFYAGFVVFSVLGFMSQEIGSSVEEIVKTGPGLAFIAYPEALSQLPIPQLWAVFFFLMLLFVAIDSMFLSVEVCITTVCDLMPKITPRTRIIVTATTCFIMFLVTLIFTTGNGIFIFQLLDWYMAALTLFLITLFESVVIGWIYGADNYFGDIEMMLGKRPSIMFKLLWRFVNPLILSIIMIYALVQYQPPSYGSYVYPSYTNYVGWLIAISSAIPIPIWFVKETMAQNGTFAQKLKNVFRANSNWGPAKDYKITSQNVSETEM